MRHSTQVDFVSIEIEARKLRAAAMHRFLSALAHGVVQGLRKLGHFGAHGTPARG